MAQGVCVCVCVCVYVTVYMCVVWGGGVVLCRKQLFAYLLEDMVFRETKVLI